MADQLSTVANRHRAAADADVGASCAERRGFSLVELVLVVAIIGIVSAIAVPRFAGATQHRKLSAAAQRLAADVSLAQTRANVTSTPVTITFAVGTGKYTMAGVPDLNTGVMPYTADLSSQPFYAVIESTAIGGAFKSSGTTQLTFNGYGLPTAGAVLTVAVATRTATVTVDAGTGRVTTP